MRDALCAGLVMLGLTAAAQAEPVAQGALASASAPATAATCEALAEQIATRIRANGVRDFELEIVPARLAEGERVVGSCDRASRKIIYVRTGAARKVPPATKP